MDMHFTEDGRLVVNNPEMREELDREKWSASAMKSFDSCPSRWVSERLLKEEGDPFGSAELGTSAHRVFELLFELPQKERTLDRAREILETLEPTEGVLIPTEPDEVERWRALVWDRVAPLWDIEDPTTVDVISCEQEIDSHVGGVPVKGFIDRVDMTPEGVAIRDYKTGKPTTAARRARFDDHGDQLRLYVRALENSGSQVPVDASIYYTINGTSYSAKLRKADINKVEKKFVETFHKMKESAETGEYATRPSPLCGWCPFATVCPTAAKNGNDTPKVDKATLGEKMGVSVLSNSGLTNHIWSRDAKMWEEQAYDGGLNPNSYAAIAVVGISSWATKMAFSCKSSNPTPKEIRGLALTLGYIVSEVEKRISSTGRVDWASGVNSRARGALHSVIAVTPLPLEADGSFSSSAHEWEEWVELCIKRCIFVLNTGHLLWNAGPTETPWSAFTD